MHIRESIKYFNIDKAIQFFNSEFKDLINEWQQKYKILVDYEKKLYSQILSWYWNELKYKTIINDEIKYFWPFIERISNDVINMSSRLCRIDNCIYWNKLIFKLNNNDTHLKNWKLKFINTINTDLLDLSGENLSLSILKLFDVEYREKTLLERSSFGIYLKDYENKKDSIHETQPLMLVEAIDWTNSIIKKMMQIVKNYKVHTFNFVKHNIIDDKPKPIEWQEMFNIWFVVRNFIGPMLKLLFRYQDKNGHEYKLKTRITIQDDLPSVYQLILNFPDNFSDCVLKNDS